MTPADVTLECRLSQSSDTLAVRYRVANRGKDTVYVMDAAPGVEGRKAFVDYEYLYVSSYLEGALLLKGIAPLPEDRSMNVRVIPLGTKVEPQASLEREAKIALPLKEQWPYDPTLPDWYEAGEGVPIHSVTFGVQFLRNTVPGFHAELPGYGKDAYVVKGSYTVGQVETLMCPLPVSDIRILRYKNPFVRLTPDDLLRHHFN